MSENRGIFASLLIVSFVVFMLSGCASSATREAMIIGEVGGLQKNKADVAVKVQGGDETRGISNEDFAQAIKESILKNGLFNRVLDEDGSQYILNVTLINITKPIFGASMSVGMEATWSLYDTDDKSVLMKELIRSSYTAEAFSAFAAVTRIRLALEGAARENIRRGLNAISQLQL